ncbi:MULTISPECIES: DUF4384 domain-containing protein [Devosia]|uniref:DUF4384 domain-containing protein n=1 Tax=Devosia TaxID=46913 RepID=UPI001319D827|nr:MULTISPECIES: DUF4384 domain-containing protein [Devosia]
MKRLTFVTLLAALIAASLPAQAQEVARDLTLAQQALAGAPVPQVGSLTVTAWVDHEDNIYAQGETINLSVMTNKPAYLTVIAVGPLGNAVQLFPNAFQPAMAIEPGKVFAIPGADAPAQITAQGPTGTELVRVIASTEPLEFISPQSLSGAGAYRTIEGGAEAIARDLALVAIPEAVEVASYDKVIHTVAQADSAEGLADIEPDTAATVHPRGPMLVTDASAYTVGDVVSMAVTALDACHLWVVAVSEDDSVNVLFPTSDQTDNQLDAQETAMVSGDGAPVQVIAAGPAGKDIVYALCGSDDTPPWEAGIDLTGGFAALSPTEPLGRALIAATAPQEAAIPEGYGWTFKVLTIHQ